MNGFLKLLKTDFSSFNQTAETKIKEISGDNSIVDYTFYFEDIDPLYCWARIENGSHRVSDYFSHMTPEQQALVVSEEQAILQGMIKE